MKVIVRFFFKRSFSRIKSNFKNAHSKRPSEVLKINFKKYLYIFKYIIFILITIKKTFDSHKNISEWTFDGQLLYGIIIPSHVLIIEGQIVLYLDPRNQSVVKEEDPDRAVNLWTKATLTLYKQIGKKTIVTKKTPINK